MKKIIIGFIQSLRLSVTIPAGLLVHIGAKISGTSTNWYLCLTVFCIAACTMLQNDYIDRKHDLKKGKTFASQNPNIVVTTLIVGWLYIGMVIYFCFPKESYLLWIGVLGGMIYSYIRKIPLLSWILVATISALPVLIGAHMKTREVYFFAFAVFLGILGRELCKDIEDTDIDKGYKNTIVSMGIFSKLGATIFAGGCMAIGFLFTLYVVPDGPSVSHGLYMSSCVCMITAVFFLWHFGHVKKGKQWFDFSMVLLLIALSL